MQLLFKLLGTAVSIGAGIVGSKLVNAAWEKTTGNKPPQKGDDAEASLRAALSFAVISAAVSAVIQVLTNRGTQQAIAKFNKSRDIV